MIGAVKVISGTVKISTSSAEGRSAILNLIGTGEVFGEIALLRDVPRMGAGESNPLDARNLMDRFEQRREIARLIVGGLVVVDDLAEQLNFLVAVRGRLRRLAHDVPLRPHPFVPMAPLSASGTS